MVQGSLHQSSQSTDPRLKALYAAQAAYAVKDSVGLAATTAGQVSKDGTDGGINLQLGIGGSHASASTRTHDEVAAGSQINSQGNVTIAATNGDLNVIGSQIKGTNVALAASHNLNLLSQAEQHTDTSRNQNASGGVGVSIGTDGLGIYAEANVGKGNQHGNGTTHLQTDVKAANTLTLISGNDTNILGAQATGKQVLANVGGNLAIASDQDTNDYASSTQQAGAKVMVGITQSGFVSGSAYYSKGDIKSNYTSVNDISGIGAGAGGYLINVGGNTDLKGGVLASTANPAKNVFNTGSLTTENLQNVSKYDVSQISVSGGSTMSSNIAGTIGTGIGLATPQGGNSRSTTQAGIAQGTVVVRNSPGQDLSGIDREPTLANQSLKNGFDLQTVQTNQQLGQVAGYVGMHLAGDIEQSANIKNGSPGAMAIHAVVGGAIAALGGGNAAQGAAGAAAGEWAIPHLTQFGNSGVLLGTGLIGALVGGGAGAATSLDGTMYNYLMHPQRHQKAEDLASCASAQACQAVQSYWDGVDASQGAALAQNLIDNGGISSELAAQLQSADPLSATYAQLLTQAIGQAGQHNPASLTSSYLAYANQYDGEPMAGPSLTGSTQAQINQINGALLGPWGLPGDITFWRGGTPQQVAAGYDFGGIVLGAATTVAELNPGATTEAQPVSGEFSLVDGVSDEIQSTRGDAGGVTLPNSNAGNTASTVPSSILNASGSLPPGIGGTGTPIPMVSTVDANVTAEQFATSAFNGQTPLKVTADLAGVGSWVAVMPDGTAITYRPAGQASSRTDAGTATVEINSPSVLLINGNKPAKFKFPTSVGGS